MPDAVTHGDRHVLLDPRAPISPDYLWSALCSALPDTRPWMIEHKDALWPLIATVAVDITAEIHRRGFERGLREQNFIATVRHGVPLTHWIHETREIPGEAPGWPSAIGKQVTAATKLLQRTRSTKDPVAWFAQHSATLAPLLLAAKWPRRVIGRSPGTATVGPLTVHDTLNLSPGLFGASVALITEAVHALQAEPVLAQVLYGNVYLTGDLRGANVLAWYWPDRDVVYMRPLLVVGRGDVHNLVHELGHRFYKRFLSSDARTLWALFHSRFGTARSPVPVAELPPIQVGVVIPNAGFTAKSEGGLTIKEVRPDSSILLEGRDGRGRVIVRPASHARVRDLMRRQALAATYPTTYAATSAEEHFCETFAFWITGESPDHPSVREFGRIVLGR